MSRRSLLASGAALAASTGLALVGCAAPGASSALSASADFESASSGGSSSSDSSSSDSSADSASGAGVALGKTVLVGMSAYGGANFNPIGFNGGTSLGMSATRHVFEGLYDLDLHTHVSYPALAQGEPARVSDVEYDVTLREGACFSDGTSVTAADVVNAFQRNMADATLGPLLGFIGAVSAKDERTVSFALNYPFESLLQARLSLVKVFPAAREAELDRLPIGSGPWAFAPGEPDGDKRVSFVPNPHYNGPFPAGAEAMTWVVTEGADKADVRATAVLDHAVHVAEGIPADSVQRLEHVGARARFVQGFRQPFLMFNTLKRPFSDKRVRQALFYAIDVERLIREIADGHAAPLTGFLPEGHPNYSRASVVYSHDPAMAKALLAAAGQQTFEFTLSVNDNWVADLAPMIAEDLADCGIACKVKKAPLRWGDFADAGRVLPYDVVLAAGDPSCFGNDPDLLLSWWYGDNVWTRGRSCWARDPQGSFATMQGLLQAAREASGEEQQQLWNQCFDIVADEVPLYGLFHCQLATGWRPDSVRGFAPISTSGLDFLGCTIA